MSANKKVIIIRKSLLESILKDTFTCLSLTVVISLGVFIESTALQWIGGILFILTILGSMEKSHEKDTYTISQARVFLDKLERDIQS